MTVRQFALIAVSFIMSVGAHELGKRLHHLDWMARFLPDFVSFQLPGIASINPSLVIGRFAFKTERCQTGCPFGPSKTSPGFRSLNAFFSIQSIISCKLHSPPEFTIARATER